MLKLGEKIISDIYLGDKKIAKAFLGDKLVYQAGKPIFLDYLITDGSSYIDSEYHPNENTYVEYTFEVFDSVQMQFNGLFGSRLGPTSFAYNFFWTNTLDLRVDWGGLPQTAFKKDLNTKYTIKAGLGRVTLNDAYAKDYTPQIEGYSPYSIYLGNFNDKGNPYTTGTPQKIYEFKAYENNVLLHDFRPCIDPKGTVCMYDMVTKKYFYNQGTGTLTAGNVIKFVDYISFDGASYIDTGINKQSCTIECTVKLESTDYRQFLCGWSHIGGYYIAVDTSNRFELGSSAIVTNSNATELSNIVAEHTETEMILTVNGNYAKRTKQVQTEPDKNYWLGNINSTSYSAPIKGQVYGHKFTSPDGVLIQDLRPCVVAGEAGFYDMVTGKIFTNAGTGTLKASGRFVESIVFDGASWIDTGIVHQTCTVETTVRFEENGTRQLMGFGSSTAQYWGKPANSVIIESLAGSNVTDKTDVIIEYNCDDLTAPTIVRSADGKTSPLSTGKTVGTMPYIIGALVWGSTATMNGYHCTCEVWNNKITINGEVVQDLRPYVDEDGIPCFYDMITNVKFYNKGTGTLSYTE